MKHEHGEDHGASGGDDDENDDSDDNDKVMIVMAQRWNMVPRYDAIPNQVVTYHPNRQTERRTFHTIDKGQYRSDMQLCMWSF